MEKWTDNTIWRLIFFMSKLNEKETTHLDANFAVGGTVRSRGRGLALPGRVHATGRAVLMVGVA